MFKTIHIPRPIKPLTKWLKTNGILSEGVRIDVDNYGKATIAYETEHYRCVLAEVSTHKPEDRAGFQTRYTHFPNPSQLYTPFMNPIIDPENVTTVNQLFYTSNLNNKQDIPVFKQIITEATSILQTNNLPLSLMPKFLALAASRIYNINLIDHTNEFTHTPKETYYYKYIEIETVLRLTVKQVINYLKKTQNVETIIEMWQLGIMPEQYETYMSDYVDAPKEWVKALFSDNIKNYTTL